MKIENGIIKVKGGIVALFAVTLMAGPSLAIELAAVPGQWSPDGGTTQIPMWGFVDPFPQTASSYTCPGVPIPWDRGPNLSVAAGPLTINLKNCLSEDVSIFIPGLAKDAIDPLAPVIGSDGQGRERLSSFDKTVTANGMASYSWTAREGTYLYQSGTDVRTQVPMGLYGALVVTGTAYPVVAQDEVLVFSEIDPALNTNPAGFGGARVSNWIPQYFLINGKTYDPANLPIDINVSEDVLLRFVNAGLQTFVPTLGGGLYMDVIAEDGNLYPYPLTQYGIELPPGKTMDAVVNAGSEDQYALYDRSLHLMNGGMLTYLQAAVATGAPTAVADSYSVAEDGTLTATAGNVTSPGVLDNDTGGAAAAVLASGPANGTLNLSADGSFTYEPNDNFHGIDQFSYAANNGAGGPNSVAATATITVTPVNDAPSAAADAYAAVAGSVLNVGAPEGVLANDSDVDGDNLTASLSGPPPPGSLTLNLDGSFTYTPVGAAGATETFSYLASDGNLNSNPATVTITVSGAAANIAPVANDDTASTPKNTPLTNYNIVANDTDDGTIVAGSVVITTGTATQRGGTVVNNNDGTITFTPKKGFRGTDTFQYTVNDNDGATSNIATVRVNVL